MERSGRSTLGVHRPAAPAGAPWAASLCEAAQGAHWVVRRSVAEVSRRSRDGGIVIDGRGRAVRPCNRLPYLRLILALSFRASDRRHWRGNPSPFLRLRRPKAATYLCRFAAKARFDNRPNPRVRFPKGRAAALPFGRFKERGFLRGEGNRNPSPLKWRFWLLLSLLTKVTRRRHKGRKSQRAGQSPAPTHVSRKPMHHTCGAMWASPPTYRLPKAYAYPTAAA